eukprot:scaffold245897_cov22-Tisochrysis_lutea.AAC.1
MEPPHRQTRATCPSVLSHSLDAPLGSLSLPASPSLSLPLALSLPLSLCLGLPLPPSLAERTASATSRTHPQPSHL